MNITKVTTGYVGIIICYNCGVPERSPEVHNLEWSKNGHLLHIKSKNFIGGGVHDKFLTIKLPTNEVGGEYSCKVTNAVGSVSENIMLGNVYSYFIL